MANLSYWLIRGCELPPRDEVHTLPSLVSMTILEILMRGVGLLASSIRRSPVGEVPCPTTIRCRRSGRWHLSAK